MSKKKNNEEKTPEELRLELWHNIIQTINLLETLTDMEVVLIDKRENMFNLIEDKTNERTGTRLVLRTRLHSTN